MFTIPFIVCVLGLLLWFVFAKTKISDAWVAEVGRLMFFAGLLVWLLANQSKAAF